MTNVLRRAVTLVVASCVVAASVLAGAGAVAANPPGPHDPFGNVAGISAPTATSVRFVGWAADPDARTANVQVGGYVDGRLVTSVVTNEARSWARRHGLGATPGFTLTVHVPRDGQTHTVCAVVRNIGAGTATVLRCTTAPHTQLSSSQLAAHNPKGALSWVSGWTHTLHVIGWSTDPDVLSRRSTVVVYVDGSAAVDAVTSRNNNSSRPPAAGPYSRYDVRIPVSGGTHMACVWSVNVGLGTGNTLLGCAAGDTRGPAGTGPVTTPDVNKKVLAEAVKHKGQPYVWGAEGPSAFDCSGLVQFAYHKFGISTPRIAADQFHSARRIPASRAVRGDLVFWYDSVGDVYHVGIVVKPGLSFAAIDTQEGINYQDTTWTTSLSYGSFTHS
jgi:cell wall-associated NlpC family hydrolase